jgi:putative flippase GtrA
MRLIIKDFFQWQIDLFYPIVSAFMPKQLFNYAYCGAFAVGVDIAVFFLSYNFLFHKAVVHIGGVALAPETASLILAFFISFPIGFTLQKYITFTNSNLKGRVQLIRYLMIVAVCFLMNYFGIKWLVNDVHVYPTIAKILVTIFVVTFSYFSQRYFSFRASSF